MARIRSIDFLPEIFKTDINREFFSATLDQLIQAPKLKRTEGYIGRRFGPGTNYTDGYLIEPTLSRANYQFEPGVVFNNSDNKTEDAITYVGMVDGLAVEGANVTRADRLFASETYSWDPHIDFDKFINYSQYYWVPASPTAVDVQSGTVATVDSFNVDRSGDYYELSGVAGDNPSITLVRGGSYTFNVNQLGNPFWIQTQPGVSGTIDYSPNLSSRNVLGVVNNGDDVGTITFNVPTNTAQSFYYGLNDIGIIDFVTTERFDNINGKHISQFGGIDGIKDLENRTLVFVSTQEGDSAELGWQREGKFDDSQSSYDDQSFDPTTYLDTKAQRYAKFRITYYRPDGSTDDDAYIELINIGDIEINDVFKVGYGTENANKKFFKNASGFFEEVPALTAIEDTLYYQDGNDPAKFGIIRLIDSETTPAINVDEDIVGKQNYTSPNGVTFINGLRIRFASDTVPTTYKDQEYIVEGVGAAIELVYIPDLVTPEDYIRTDTEQYDLSPFDTSGYDANLNSPTGLDYITIKRSATDHNAWNRSNRWFHIDVLNATAEYNNTVAELDNNNRAKRPIIEFDSGLRLYNYGTESKGPIDIIDLAQTDALSNVHGSTRYNVDGYELINGSRIIFAADNDLTVRNRIYEVQIVDPDDASTEYGQIINLIPAADAAVLEDQTVVCINGATLQGKVYRYTGSAWAEAQQKTSLNQEPLFDVFDSDGYSYSDISVYPSTTFAGTKLFSYKRGTGINDYVLEFPLTYLNIDNLGDIVFENNLYVDDFIYVSDGSSVTKNVSAGFIRQYSTRTNYTLETGWTASADRNWSRQVFTLTYNGDPLVIDIAPKIDLLIPAIKVYANNKFVLPSHYTAAVTNGKTTISFDSTIATGSTVQIKVISDTASGVGYYEIPSNLESNIFNENTNTFTLGTIRNHYNRLIENVTEFTGEVNGINNLKELGPVAKYGDVIVQHSAPVAPMAHFLRKKKYDFFASLEYSAKQYEKFKHQIIDWIANNDTYGMEYYDILDAALASINHGKTKDTAFYWSDMVPFGGDYQETVYTINPISTDTFNTINVYDFTKSNSSALLIYYNNEILTKDLDYTVATDGPRFTLLFTPSVGDTIRVREYSSTYGNFVPPTPTKIGSYARFEPKIYVDDTYVTPQTVIQGHDGSITIGFNDVRDYVLLEFERRIYNNLKSLSNDSIPLKLADVIPGKFRATDYTDVEITELLSAEMLDWCGWNKIDYKTQEYRANNSFTWNYSTTGSALDSTPLKGHWRGIYKYYYDTDRPHTHPWEMLGFAIKPSWWEDRYGPAPYTSGNEILWDDLEAGYNRNDETYDARYARPGLSNIIPVTSSGKLRNPFEFLVSSYNETDFVKSWVVGDVGPVESAWRRSSVWPFVVQKLFALTKPAEFFALNIDLDRYRYNTLVNEYVYDNRYRLDFRNTEIYSDTTPKNSYINWIIEYNRSKGILSGQSLIDSINSVDVKLCYRMAGFTDKNYLKIFTDKSSPNSSNTSLLIPDESYSLLLYKNQPFGDVQYSSVMVQRTVDGFAVYGNSSTQAYFRILQSTTNGDYTTATVGSTTIRIPNSFTNRVVRVPYGYTFKNINSVVDFLISYGKFLETAGFVFEDTENNYVLDWGRMAQEFVYWANQNWTVGSLINLNAAANVLQYNREFSVVDNINDLDVNDQMLDQNRQVLQKKDYAITRLDNNFKITILADKSLSYLRLRNTSYEHLLVVDNVSIFNDLMYQPVTGLRQQRIKINGFTTFEWNGQLDAQGFILNQDNVPQWNQNNAYNKGDMVRYKNSYWTAAKKIQPEEQFDFDQWTKIDYQLVNKGLLPNINSKADQITKFYNSSVANLETDVDLLALGIIGFRPRGYLESLNLDDISQVSVYSDLIEGKGTVLNANLFKGVEFDKETSEYDIYENWAVRRATYGASDNKRFIEVALDKDSTSSNPTVIEINAFGTESDADQFVDINSIYKQSVKNSTINIFPTLNKVVTDATLPTAGFVNKDDIDISLYDLNDLTEINNNLNLIRDGAYVWVAKENKYNWNVYRCSVIDPTLISVIDNLNNTLTLEFDATTNLVKNDLIIAKYFNSEINGTHRVIDVLDVKTITVSGSLDGDVSELTGSGIVFKLLTAKVSQPSDIADTEYNNNILAGDRVWVNGNIDGKWEVYEKTTPFDLVTRQYAPGATGNYNFGASLAQGFNDSGLIVGAPDYASGSADGAIYCYNKDKNTYVFSALITQGANKAAGFGNSASMSTNWAVVGANESISNQGLAVVIYRNPAQNLFQSWQYLTTPNGISISGADQFGSDVVVSENENWIYVGAPAAEKVFAYERITYQDQTATFTSTGGIDIYNIDGLIEVNNATQITVTVDDVIQASSEYALTGTNLQIFGSLDVGSIVEVTRKSAVETTGDGSTTVYTHPSTLYTAQTIEMFSVYVGGVLQRPYYDYTFDTATQYVTFVTAPANGDTVSFRATDHWMFKNTISSPLLGSNRFGEKVATTSDGQQVIIAAPEASFDGLNNAGKTFIYERVVERRIVEDSLTRNYSALRNLSNKNSVYINGTKQLININNIGYSYSINTVTNSVEIASEVNLNVGDKIDIDINNYNLVQTLTLLNNNQGAYFGSQLSVCRTDCSLYVSAPRDHHILPEAGSVTRYLNGARVFGLITGTVENPTVTVGHSIRINNVDVVFTNTTLSQVVDDINNSIIPNVHATTANNKLVISVINAQEAPSLSKMTVMPGIGTAFNDLGLEPFVNVQVIRSPRPEEYSRFGSSVHVDYSATNLVVGSEQATSYLPTTFDNDETEFDSDATKLIDRVVEAGAVYTFDLLPSSSYAVPGKFVFGQQIINSTVDPLDKFGKCVNFTDNLLIITSPGADANTKNVGEIVIYENPTREQAWKIIQQQPDSVDTDLIGSIYLYNSADSQLTTYLDFIDPINNKLLGVVQQNLDYTGANDPARYNNQTVNKDITWSSAHVGKLWWDTTNTRYINYNQSDIVYSAKNWGTFATDSIIEVYEWVESLVPPSQYSGPGTVRSTTNYSTLSGVDRTNTVITKYYFWVKNNTTVNKTAGKTLSPSTIASYIEYPQQSGIPYAALIRKNVIALYNTADYIVDNNESILHVEYNQSYSDNKIFVEYDLIRENYSRDFLPEGLYRKLQDSFCGADTVGNLVPDVTLSPTDRYGIDFRPRKSLFRDRYAALKSYINKANSLITDHPLAELRTFNILASKEEEPVAASGAWDARVDDLEELNYQDLLTVDVGYKYLVRVDSDNNGRWTIYEVQNNKTLQLIRVQNYNTPNYWNYIDWYEAGYTNLSKPSLTVDTYSELLSLSVSDGTLAKVRLNSNGKWELYVYSSNNIEWTRVGLEDGTIEFKQELWNYSAGRYGFDSEVFDAQYFDQQPVIETRQIIRAINEEIFVGDFLDHRNQLLISVFNYILAEHGAVDWLYKTSLIDVKHRVRELIQYNVYRKDNQTFVEDYINESKPYHTKVKEFLLSYEGLDTISGNVYDYDCPAAFDSTYEKFVSPILDDGIALLETDVSNRQDTDAVWAVRPWSTWYNNHKLNVDSIVVTDSGSNYTVAPRVVISGTADQAAEAIALINSVGQVIDIQITVDGIGYRETPTVTLVGGNGTGATATAYMSNELVRSIKTVLRYDRYEYESQVLDWEANTVYNENQLVRYNNKVYRAINADGSTASESEFDPALYELVAADTLSGIDRTSGLYVADVNNPGLDIALLIDGIDYPGVQVKGPLFDQNTGFDVGNFDVNPWDNIDFGPEGLPTYSPEILDAEYVSNFTDSYFGTLPAAAYDGAPPNTNVESVIADGADFIDVYNSHAPEELVPGAIFDTLDMTVYTQPGHDYNNDGHGFQVSSVAYVADGRLGFSFDGVVESPVEIAVFNGSTGTRLYRNRDFTINWGNRTIDINSGVNSGDSVKIYVYEVGGAFQIYRDALNGAKVGNSVKFNVNFDDIDNTLIVVNGSIVTDYTYSAVESGVTEFRFGTTYTSNDFVSVTLFGDPNFYSPDSTLDEYSYSFPQIEVFTATNALSTFMLEGNIAGAALENVIVELNGKRLRGPDGVRRTGDATTIDFYLPDGERTGTDQSLLDYTDIEVFVGDVLQTPESDYWLSSADESSERFVTFLNPPGANRYVDIYINSAADYKINRVNSELTITSSSVILSNGDVVAVTSWRDVRKQDPLTVSYVGPKVINTPISELFDTELFDAEPWDYATGIDSSVNEFELYRTVVNADRLWVTLDGRRLLPGENFSLSSDGTYITITEDSVGANSKVVITSFTESLVPDELAFKIFNDMRGNAAVYRMIPASTTYLTEQLKPWSDTIYVNDVSKLGEPNLDAGIFGIVNVNGERITYRERNLENNSISGLRRGTAGTSVREHQVNTQVNDMSRGNLLDTEYDRIWYAPGVGTAADGNALQKQNTYAARFLRGD